MKTNTDFTLAFTVASLLRLINRVVLWYLKLIALTYVYIYLHTYILIYNVTSNIIRLTCF